MAICDRMDDSSVFFSWFVPLSEYSMWFLLTGILQIEIAPKIKIWPRVSQSVIILIVVVVVRLILLLLE